MQHSSRQLLSSLVELVLPRTCVGCGCAGVNWCRGCFEQDFRPVLHRPDPCPSGLPLLAAAGAYTASIRRAVLAAKEQDQRELDRALGAALAAAAGLLIATGSLDPVPSRAAPVWLIPVPASKDARRLRGRDHVRDWTRWAVRWLQAEGIPARCVPAVTRRPGGLDSVGLDAGQRAINLSGAFSLRADLRSPPTGTTVVIVDDVVTTGATLVAVTACLPIGPAQLRVGAAVVAATQRHPKL